MRQSGRIPICLKLFRRKHIFLKLYDSEFSYNLFFKNYRKIKKQWETYPDLRFTQLLINEGYMNDGLMWNIEEDDWLVENDFISIENIKYWGINYSKEGEKLDKTQFKMLKDLELSHIINIIKFFERHDSLNQLNKKYLEYFIKRIKKNE